MKDIKPLKISGTVAPLPNMSFPSTSGDLESPEGFEMMLEEIEDYDMEGHDLENEHKSEPKPKMPGPKPKRKKTLKPTMHM